MCTHLEQHRCQVAASCLSLPVLINHLAIAEMWNCPSLRSLMGLAWSFMMPADYPALCPVQPQVPPPVSAALQDGDGSWRLVLPGSHPELWCSLALQHHFSWGHASLQWATESSREDTLPLWNISSESFTCDFRGGKIDPKYVSPPTALNLASKCWLGKGWELTQNVSSAASKQDGSRATTARADPVVFSPQCTTSAYVLQHS